MATKKILTIASGGAALFALMAAAGFQAARTQATGEARIEPPTQSQTSERSIIVQQSRTVEARGAPTIAEYRGQVGQTRQLQPVPGFGGGGGAAMVEDNNFLYVLQGGRLFKVQKSDLRIVAQAFLMGQGGPERAVEPSINRRSVNPPPSPAGSRQGGIGR